MTDLDGNVHRVEVLDTDSNGDSIKDTNSTCVKNGFIYVDLDQDTLSSIAKIELIDCDGTVFASVDANLDFGEVFFEDCEAFVTEYNADFKSDKLSGLNDALLAKTNITK